MGVVSHRARSVGQAAGGVALALIVAACGTPAPTPSPRPAPTATITASPTAAATAGPTLAPSPTPPRSTVFPIAVITRYDDTRSGITPEALAAALAAGKVIVPCEVTTLVLGQTNVALPTPVACLPASEITARVHGTKAQTGPSPARPR